ncbi:hypothetical protein Tco_0552685, partial [Tanacetum coccineum]
TLRYEVGESSTAAPRPTRGHGIDYGFIGTLDAETRRQRAEGAVKNQVKFATCTFLGNALTWWNSHMKTVTQDVAYC